MTSPPQGAPGPAPDAVPTHREPTPEQFLAVQRSEEFQGLRRAFRGFAIPMTVAFLVWYLAYVLLSTFAEGFMSIPVIGYLNVGILLGLSQFLMTFLITWAYIRHANRSLDPIAEKLRHDLEGDL
ncbi:DUF485 domain-containing protein [Brachybacterium sp. YJGR34]|uniref:DUF485 domain-containing protein n=1 Tax=Brachybacterium sp. YJGR34 TaxID=2059911 RepID=UPI000E0CAB17|nr:DUF485 domain-containing protein [Brachybacterium sp. YJGR34]